MLAPAATTFNLSKAHAMTARISIGGCIICGMDDGYRRWFFNRNDRVVRSQPSRGGGLEYLYVTTAKELRQRLDIAGWNRASLEIEFRAFENKAERFKDLPYLEDTPKQALDRAHSVEHATLEDWLGALGKARVFYDCSEYTLPHFHNYKALNPSINLERLSECVTNAGVDEYLCPVSPTHGWLGFPCTSLECMAVAMLEVVRDDCECVLDVTWLVQDRNVYCFDDLLEAAAANMAIPTVARPKLDSYQLAALFDDV